MRKPNKKKKKQKKTKNRGRKKKRTVLTFDLLGNISEAFKGKPDNTLISLVGFLCLSGLLMIYSASAIAAYNDPNIGDSFFYFNRQIIWIFLGVTVAATIYIMPLNFLRGLSPIILSIGILLLLIMVPEAVFGVDMPFVITRNGATRWIDLIITDIQPAELVKFGAIAYVSAWLTRKNLPDKPKNMSAARYHFNYTFLPFFLLLGFISALILAQRDLDTVIILALSIMAVYYVSGQDRLHSIGTLLIMAVGAIAGAFALFFESYRRDRVLSFFTLFRDGRPTNEELLSSSFQVWNGLIGFGSGWLFGRGFGESRIKQGFLQEAAYTDSIFVVIGEEFGLIGAIAVIISFLLLAAIGYSIATKAQKPFHMLLVTGMTTWIIVQAFLNIAANVALIPFGGMPLPFFSYGGSSMITIMMAIGVLLNVSRINNMQEVSMRGR